MRGKLNKLIIGIFFIGIMFTPTVQNVSAMEIEPLNEFIEIETYDEPSHYDIELVLEARPGDCRVEIFITVSTGMISGIHPIDGITSNNGVYQATVGGEWLSYPNTADITARISASGVPGEYTIDFDEETGLILVTFTPESTYCEREEETDNNVIVEVPDTLMNIPGAIYIAGAILIFVGFNIILFSTKKKNKLVHKI